MKSGRVANHALSSVLGAGQSSSRQGSARPTVGARVIDVPQVPVYNLMVADGYPPEYYANGVLVHNCTWNPDEDNDSPDRVDALVHGITYLLNREKNVMGLASPHAMGLGRARGPVEHPIARIRRRNAS